MSLGKWQILRVTKRGGELEFTLTERFMFGQVLQTAFLLSSGNIKHINEMLDVRMEWIHARQWMAMSDLLDLLQKNIEDGRRHYGYKRFEDENVD
jgi:hypothetical protein